jgi:hypothetical protein
MTGGTLEIRDQRVAILARPGHHAVFFPFHPKFLTLSLFNGNSNPFSCCALVDAHHASHVLASTYSLQLSILFPSILCFFVHFLLARINPFITWVTDFRNSRTLVLFLTGFDLCLSYYFQSLAPIFLISRSPVLRACCAQYN